jgi:hypothetical protein
MSILHRPAAVWPLCALCVGVASACGKSENDWPVTPPDKYTYDEFAAQLPDFLCGHFMRCPAPEADVLLPRALFRSVARCVEVLNQAEGATRRNFDPRSAIKAGRIVFHPDEARGYLDSLAGPCDSSGVEADPTAGGAFEGTVAPGGSCVARVECETGNYCEHAEGACPGVCTKLKPTGEACAGSTDCESSYCSADTCSKLTLLPEAADGEPCGFQSGAYATRTPCAQGLFCQGLPTGVCRKAIPADAPCVGPNDVCALDHLCLTDVDSTKRCRPIAVAQEGDRCTGETSPDIRLCDAFSSLACEQNVCVSFASGTEGSGCVRTLFGDSCADGFHCALATQTCEQLGQTGDPCSASDECASGWCVSGNGTCSAERCE